MTIPVSLYLKNLEQLSKIKDSKPKEKKKLSGGLSF